MHRNRNVSIQHNQNCAAQQVRRRAKKTQKRTKTSAEIILGGRALT